MKRVAIIFFPGSNSETETFRSVAAGGMRPEMFPWTRSAAEIEAFDGYVVVGGFAHEDRGRAGLVASFSPIVAQLKLEAARGKPILGICNGAQVLIESGIVPGDASGKHTMSLARNIKRFPDGDVGSGFYNGWIHLRKAAPTGANAFNLLVGDDDILTMPVAHGEGRFVTTQKGLYDELVAHHQIAYQYCLPNGELAEYFPENPNGTIMSIAAVTNRAGNAMAIMPHPERGVVTPGLAIFTSMAEYLKRSPSDAAPVPAVTTSARALPNRITQGTPDRRNLEVFIRLLISDNVAYTIEQTLHTIGIEGLHLDRERYFSIELADGADPANVFQRLQETGLLFNENKEAGSRTSSNKNGRSIIVFDDDDPVAKGLLRTLQNRFGFTDIRALRQGTKWNLHASDPSESAFQRIMSTHMFYNPNSQSVICYPSTSV